MAHSQFISQFAVTGATESKEIKHKPQEKKDAWEITSQRCQKLFTKIKVSDVDWYRTNTRHHLSVFEQQNLPRDIKYVWSIFSGPCPEFLALEQYINKGFHYTAIDNDEHHINSAKYEFSDISTSCSTEFIYMDLANWIKKDITIDRNARHLLYFGHPYLLSDSEAAKNIKQMIVDTIIKFKSANCAFDLYAGLYYEKEYQIFLNILQSVGFPKKSLGIKEIQDPQVSATSFLLSGGTETIQPNRYSIILNSPKPTSDLSKSATETGRRKSLQRALLDFFKSAKDGASKKEIAPVEGIKKTLDSSVFNSGFQLGFYQIKTQDNLVIDEVVQCQRKE